MTFYEYMKRYLNEDSNRGDLAEDIYRDEENWSDYEGIKRYLIFRYACDECLETFDECWEEFILC